MPNELKLCPFCGEEPQKVGFTVMHCCRVLDMEIRVPLSCWNHRARGSKTSIDFDKIATSFHPAQIKGYMQQLNYTRKCALLYLWFYNNVSVNWLTDVKRDNGRGMYRKFAEAISNRILEK